MMRYRFEREVRTPFSEAYSIFLGERKIGRIDLHFAPDSVYGGLWVIEDMTLDEIRELREEIDEELVMSADSMREDFVLSVYQGREVGVFTDTEESPFSL